MPGIYLSNDSAQKLSGDLFQQSANSTIADHFEQQATLALPDMLEQAHAQEQQRQAAAAKESADAEQAQRDQLASKFESDAQNVIAQHAATLSPPQPDMSAAPPADMSADTSAPVGPPAPSVPAPPPEPAPASLTPASAPAPSVPAVTAQPATPTTAGLSGGGDLSGRVGAAGQAILSAAGDAASWLGDQGQKALQAVLITEGGLSGARGDKGQSAGPLQFYSGGQLANFAQQHGLSQDAAMRYVEQNPEAAVQWAIGTQDAPGYLGQAILAGQKQGLQGADLATYAQQHGQVSVSPERAGQNWQALFGQGADAISGAGQGAMRLVNAAVQNVASTFSRESQFGVGLSPADAYAACGPVAAMAFAKATGREPTAQEALDLAKSVGWTQSSGMAGPNSEVDLLKKMGVSSHLEGGADPNKIMQDVQNGNPVMISTAGHYFTADAARTTQDGTQQFHVGTSGTDLRQGSDWMSLADMQRTMGAIQGTLYMDRKPGDGPSVAVQSQAADTAQAAPTDQTAASTSTSWLDPLKGIGDAVQGAGSAVGNAVGGAASAVGSTVQSGLSGLGSLFHVDTPEERAARVANFSPEFQALAAQTAAMPVRASSPLEMLGQTSNLGGVGLTMPEYQQLQAQKQQDISAANPLRDVPVLGGATSMAAGIATDPLTYMGAFGGAGRAGGAVEAALGGGFKGTVANQATQGALLNALQAAEQPGATSQDIAVAAAQGGALGGGVGAAGGALSAAATDPAVQAALRAKQLGQADANFASGGLGGLVSGHLPAPVESAVADAAGAVKGGVAPFAADAATQAPPVSGGVRIPDTTAPVTAGEAFNLYRMGNLVSSPYTVAKVAFNALTAPVWSLARDTATLGRLNPETVVPEWHAALGSLGNAGGAFLDALTTGSANTAGGLPTAISARVTPGVPQALARIWELPGNIHGALQAWSSTIVGSGELGRLAAIAGQQQGLSGGKLMSFVQRVMADPAQAVEGGLIHPELLAASQAAGDRAALRGDLGTLGSALVSARNKAGFVGDVLMPIVKIPLNDLTQNIEKSPLGLLGTGWDVARGAVGQGPYAAGQVNTAVTPVGERLGNNLLGTAISAFLVSKALEGNITGAGPTDPTQLAALRKTNWQPDSLNVPGLGWVPASKLPPGVAEAVTIAGNIADIQRYDTSGDLGKKAGELAGRLASQFQTAPGIQQGGQIFEMLKGLPAGDVSGIARFAGGLAGSMVPMDAALKAGASAVSGPPPPVDRKADIPTQIGQSVLDTLPMLRGIVPDSKKAKGDAPELYPGTGLSLQPTTGLPLDPATGQPMNNAGPILAASKDPVGTALSMVSLSLPQQPPTIAVPGSKNRVNLSPAESAQYVSDVHDTLGQMGVMDLFKDPGFLNSPTKDQQAEVRKYLTAAEQQAASNALTAMQNPEQRVEGYAKPTPKTTTPRAPRATPTPTRTN